MAQKVENIFRLSARRCRHFNMDSGRCLRPFNHMGPHFCVPKGLKDYYPELYAALQDERTVVWFTKELLHPLIKKVKEFHLNQKILIDNKECIITRFPRRTSVVLERTSPVSGEWSSWDTTISNLRAILERAPTGYKIIEENDL